ncbi:MAG: NAD-dependent epimerase/dehydratase family protein, partial [Proteobacteria bacterium]
MAKLANCKILITGVNGQVGYEIIKALASSGAHLVLASRSPEKQTIFGYETVYLDLARPEEIKRVISEVQPHILINPAAYTAVDKAESAENDAFAINKNAVEAMVESMEILNGAIIHFSTDYVYNPKHSDPALESDSQNPSNVYAASKLAGDMILCDSDIPFIILRTSWVYGLNGNNFVKTMLKLGAERSSLSIVNDQVGSPTSATTLANAVLTILQRGHEDPKSFIQLNRGIYNI